MACWKVGTGDLIASLLLLLELESESVDGECCGILVEEEEEVLIAETAKQRRGRNFHTSTTISTLIFPARSPENLWEP